VGGKEVVDFKAKLSPEKRIELLEKAVERLSEQVEKLTPKKVSLEAKQLAFKAELNAYYKANHTRYPVEMYKEFFEYWGIPENKQRPTKLVYQAEKSWNLPKRLSNWYSRTEKGKEESEPKIVASAPRRVNMDD
jgi:hypothetical protein